MRKHLLKNIISPELTLNKIEKEKRKEMDYFFLREIA